MMYHASSKSLESLDTPQWLGLLLVVCSIVDRRSCQPTRVLFSCSSLFLPINHQSIENILSSDYFWYYLDDNQHLVCDALRPSMLLIVCFNKTINQCHVYNYRMSLLI